MTGALVPSPAPAPLPLFAPTPQAAKRVVEFFTAQISNAHTRRAYLNAKQAFAKLKALLCKRALRTLNALWKSLGRLPDCFKPDECANFLRHAGYFQSG